MPIKGVTPKCYILSLFVRDDGERFVLGSGYYEFKDKQMHFKANTVANDVIEVQGNDGYLLAGQVRRPGAQEFDGFVGDGTVSKAEVEQKRRAFLAFFRKNHFYKVVYVFSDGTAIQRKRGFLVDDPTVKELYQIYPEYHVALNFEDVNYYSYAENDDGEEIYSKIAQIQLTQSVATGGLIWDSYGVVWDARQWGGTPASAGGSTSFTVNNQAGNGAPLASIQLNGDTFQQTYSGANLYDYTDTTLINPNVTVGDDGWLTATYDASGSSTVYLQYYTNPLPLTADTNYNVVLEVESVSGNGYITPVTGNAASQFAADWTLNFDSLSDNTVYTHTSKTKADISGSTYSLRTVLAFSASWSGSIKFRLSLLADTSVTPQTFVYQPYVGGTASPNPDYPQDIQVVTGAQTVQVSDGVISQDYTVNLSKTSLVELTAGNPQDGTYDPTTNTYTSTTRAGVSTWTQKILAGSGSYTFSSTSITNGEYRYCFSDQNLSAPNDIITLAANTPDSIITNGNRTVTNTNYAKYLYITFFSIH